MHAAKLGRGSTADRSADLRLWTAIDDVDARRRSVRRGCQAEAACAGAVLDEVLEDVVLDDEDLSDVALEGEDSALTLDLSPARLSVR